MIRQLVRKWWSRRGLRVTLFASHWQAARGGDFALLFHGCFVRVAWDRTRMADVALSGVCLEVGRNQWLAESPWTDSARPGRVRALGAPKHFHTGKIASRKSPSMAALSPETTHRTGSEAVAAATGAPARCAAWQSSVGYAARDGPGDPRGWKSAAGPETTNPR
jgi:hypothetical protein